MAKIKSKKSTSKFVDSLKQIFSTNINLTVKDGKSYKLQNRFDVKDKNNKDVIDSDDKISSILYAGNTYADNYSNYNQEKSEVKSRLNRYKEFDDMDNDSIISSALDIYADEVTTKGDTGEILNINSEHEEIQEALYLLYYKILEIDKNLWGWVRNTCKRGDHTVIINVNDKYGITNFYDVSPYRVERIEDIKNHGKETKFKIDDNSKRLLNKFQVMHFRLISENNNYPYGTSLLRGVITQWQSLKLMEDAMMINWVTRAPERRIFKIDVGNLKPEDAKKHITTVKNSIKKTPVIDPKTGKYNLKFNVKNMLDDFFVTKRGNKYGTEIDTLPGLQGMEIDNIEYLQNKMFAGLKIPKMFLNYGEDIQNKSTVVTEDERFSRTIERLQTTIITPVLYEAGKLHLYALGIDEKIINEFSISLNTPSLIREQLKLDLLSTKLSIIRDVKDSKMFDTDWAYANIFEISKKEGNKLKRAVMKDKYMEYRYEKMEQDGEKTPIKPTEFDPESDTVDESLNVSKLKVKNTLAEITKQRDKFNNIGMYKSYKKWLTETSNKNVIQEENK